MRRTRLKGHIMTTTPARQVLWDLLGAAPIHRGGWGFDGISARNWLKGVRFSACTLPAIA
jgi:hypothetical protein